MISLLDSGVLMCTVHAGKVTGMLRWCRNHIHNRKISLAHSFCEGDGHPTCVHRLKACNLFYIGVRRF